MKFPHLPLAPSVQKDDVLAALSGRYLDFYQSHTPLKRVGSEWRGACPLHKGTGLNFTVDPETGYWFCHSQCQEGGDILAFVQKYQQLDFPAAVAHLAEWAGHRSPPPPTVRFAAAPTPAADVPLDPCHAASAHARLRDALDMRRWLFECRGLTDDTLQRFQVGLLPPEIPSGAARVTFPVYDREGHLSNIRKHLFAYAEGLDRTNKTLPWTKGLRSDLYPLSVLDGAGDVLLVEGEADALLANQLGFCAVTGTLGAGTWKAEWTEDLRGRSVTLLYDNDDAGQAGAYKAALALAGGCSVRLAVLPDGKGKDLTEWIVTHGGTTGDLQAASPPLFPSQPPQLQRMP